MNLKKTNSLTFRLTLLFATASTVVLLALGFLVRESVNKHFAEQGHGHSVVECATRQANPVQRAVIWLSVPTKRSPTTLGDRIAIVGLSQDGSPSFSIGVTLFQ